MDFEEIYGYAIIEKTMKINVLKILLFTVSCFIIGCNTQSYLVDVYTPSKLELPPDLRAISVFNRFVPATGDYDRVIWGAYDSLDSTMLKVADSCTSAFSTMLGSSKKFNAKMPTGERMFRHNGPDLPEPLPSWEGLIKIAERQFTDGLIMLEAFDMTDQGIEISENNGIYTAVAKYEVITGWRIYQASRRRYLDESVYHTNYSVSASGASEQAARDSLPSQENRMIAAAKFAGEEYAKFITPKLISVKRKIYVKGNKVIEDAAAFVEEGSWGRAEDKWNYHAYNGESDELKAMCSYNMAILSEKEGYINRALGYARRAQRLMPSNLHLELINELTIRAFDIEEKYKSGEIVKNW
jgi:hypothetical protein